MKNEKISLKRKKKGKRGLTFQGFHLTFHGSNNFDVDKNLALNLAP
jgi:hypothetical protein